MKLIEMMIGDPRKKKEITVCKGRVIMLFKMSFQRIKEPDIIMKKYMQRKVREAGAIEREMIAERNDKN
jgi:hypothetical protein